MRSLALALPLTLLGCGSEEGAVGVTSAALSAPCLSGGSLLICDNPLIGKAPQETVVGGALLGGGGFRVDAKGDHVTFDLGAQASSAIVRFSLANVSPSNLDQDTHLVLLATDTPTLSNPAPKRVLELKIWGNAVDPNAQGTTILGAGDGVQEAKKSAGKPGWSAQTEYVIDVSWDHTTQRLSLVRSGQTLLDFKTGDVIPGPNNPPVDLHFRYVHLAMPYLANKAFAPIVASVYGMASISADVATPDAGPKTSPDAAISDGAPLDAPAAAPDAQTISAKDANAPAIDPPEPLAPSSSGCSASAARPTASGALLLVALLVMRRRARRRT